MKILHFLSGLVVLVSLLTDAALSLAQSDVSRVMVSTELLRKHVYLLASDSLQGRLTGTAGQQQAGLYCLRTFRQNHLGAVFRIDSTHRSFRQTFPFTATEVTSFGASRFSKGNISVTVNGADPTYRSAPSSYKRYELASSPRTARDSSQVLFGDNIAGVLVGTDLKQEIIVLSAHYDHLGNSGKRVYHGADDNASGTAAVLSVASVFDSLMQAGFRSRRSLLFILFSGEEGGLLGSKYFVGNSPVPLAQLVCDLNADMVGRVDNAHRKDPDYCYLLDGTTNNVLLQLAEKANQQSVKLAINRGGYDVKSDPAQHFLRSDQYSFARLGIPALFFTSGEHPDYHQPTDTADKIEYEVLQKRATLLFQTAWLLANPAP